MCPMKTPQKMRLQDKKLRINTAIRKMKAELAEDNTGKPGYTPMFFQSDGR